MHHMSRSDEELTRFTMSLPTADYERLGELAGLLGVSRASLMRDLIEASRPVWAVLIDAARTTATATTAQKEAMNRLAEQMGAHVDQSHALLDLFGAVAADAAEPGDDGPPASNTGVRNL